MIDKNVITKKLEHFFTNTNPEELIKVFISSFLYDKSNYIETIVGHENALKMIEKNIYNLEQNIKVFKKLEKNNSIYAKYDLISKSLKYYLTNNYSIINNLNLSPYEKKELIIKEFKIMMYKELEAITNIDTLNKQLISNGFYIKNDDIYLDYEGDFSNIIDIFYDIEACNIIEIEDRIKVYIDENNQYFVYAKHYSQRNQEVMCYVELWRKFFDNKHYYYAIYNPKKFSQKMIDDFNNEYNYVLLNNNFLLEDKDIFSLIENYLLHIKNKIDIENNIRYHKDLSKIFNIMNYKKNINKISEYLLHNSNTKSELIFE